MTVLWSGVRGWRSFPQSNAGSTTTARGMYGAESASLTAPAGFAEAVREDGLVPPHLAVDRARVRVEQQLARIAPGAAAGVVRAVDAEAVALPGPTPGT